MLAHGALRAAVAPYRPVIAAATFGFLAASACSSSSNMAGGEDGGGADATGDSPLAPEAGSTDASAEGAGDAASAIVVTSPAFAEGQTIPNVYTCAGADTSPEIDWTAGPAATQSYAVVVSDLTATANIHWVIWDLPPGARSLPAALPGDPVLTSPVSAKQVDLRTNPDAGTTMNGYFGPCPRGNLHRYGFAVHALDVPALPEGPGGVTTSSRSADVKAVVLQHTLAMGTLTGTSDAGPPPDGGNPTDGGGQ